MRLTQPAKWFLFGLTLVVVTGAGGVAGLVVVLGGWLGWELFKLLTGRTEHSAFVKERREVPCSK